MLLTPNHDDVLMILMRMTPPVQVLELHRKDLGSRYVECVYDKED